MFCSLNEVSSQGVLEVTHSIVFISQKITVEVRFVDFGIAAKAALQEWSLSPWCNGGDVAPLIDPFFVTEPTEITIECWGNFRGHLK